MRNISVLLFLKFIFVVLDGVISLLAVAILTLDFAAVEVHS